MLMLNGGLDGRLKGHEGMQQPALCVLRILCPPPPPPPTLPCLSLLWTAHPPALDLFLSTSAWILNVVCFVWYVIKGILKEGGGRQSP